MAIDDEFFSSEAGGNDVFVFADDLADFRRHGPEGFVSGIVPVAVVDRFEMVQIERDDREIRSRILLPERRRRFEKPPSVRKSRERVFARETLVFFHEKG